MNLRHLFSRVVSETAIDLGIAHATNESSRSHFEVTRSDRSDLADYQCNAALSLSKVLRKPPREIALMFQVGLVEKLNGIADVAVAGPGFINFRVDDEWLSRHATQYLREVRDTKTTGRNVIIDFGGPNIAKELHVGHLRPHLIGDCLQRIMRYVGDNVISDIHMGDWGTPLGMIIAQLHSELPQLPFFSANETQYPLNSPVTVEELGEVYRRSKMSWDSSPLFQKKARETTEMLQSGAHRGYRALWQQLKNVSVDNLRQIYALLGIEFDLWLGESDVQHMLVSMVDELLNRKIAIRNQGATIILAETLGLSDMPPLILQKTDGGFTYAATDLATIKDRVENRRAGTIIYVVDNRQKQHFEQVFAGARVSGYAPSHVLLEHVGHGTINGPDGRPFKTRDGSAVKLSDILDLAANKALDELPRPGEQGMTADDIAQLSSQIGIGAIKFQELRNSRTTDYIFNFNEFTRFEGKTGPYLQYAAARAISILMKSGNASLGTLKITQPSERDLLLHLCRLPESVEVAYASREPNIIAEHAYGLVQRFGTFYNQAPVLQEADPDVRESRIALVEAFSRQLGNMMGLLNIQSPVRMLRRAPEAALS